MLNLTRQERLALLFVSFLLILGGFLNYSLKKDPAWLKTLDIHKEGLKPVKVDINSASQEELTAVPGIGPVTAAAIIAYRSANGAFRTIDDLDKVKGIGENKLLGMREYLLCR